jgi:MoxR-like ATPase
MESTMADKRFKGTSSYIATDDLMMAVNAAVTLERPILIKGEPGTGKTQLAMEVARALDRPLHEWHIKSTTKAQQGLYDYDAVARLRDSQLGDDRVHDIANYIVRGKIWEAFESDEKPVLLIDEIDKADIEFPNDSSDAVSSITSSSLTRKRCTALSMCIFRISKRRCFAKRSKRSTKFVMCPDSKRNRRRRSCSTG